MKKPEAKSRISKLKKEIAHHRYLYHVLDSQVISDAALDSLKHELVELEQEFPEFLSADSPSQRVSGQALDKFEKVKHLVRQWSFNDAFSADEVRAFDGRVKKGLSKKEKVAYTAELKIDGLHVVLTYEKGVLVTAATRGDGKIGENVTQNVKTIASIPLRLRQDVSVIVEGEIYMTKTEFKKLNKRQEKAGKPLFANPRNVSAGSIRQLDPEVTRSRNLDCFLYDISGGEYASQVKTQDDELKTLKKLGFKTNKHFTLCKNIEEVIAFKEKWEKKRDKEDYWFDGVVVKVNDGGFQNRLGFTGKAPRWAIAYKFPAEQTTTVIEGITVQVGRTGALTPAAELRLVQLAGTTVKRATLHNIDQIQRLDVRIGDTVIIQKAGDIIPEVVEVIKNLRPKGASKFAMPKKCPVCGEPVERRAGEVAYYCTNDNCYAQRRRGVEHFVAKPALNVDGLGPQIIDKLFQSGLIKDSADLYSVTVEDLMGLEGFKEKSSEKIVRAIHDRKTVELRRFLSGLGIKLIGVGVAELIVKHLAQDHWQNSPTISVIQFQAVVSKQDVEHFAAIEGIGKKVAESLVGFFSDHQNQKLFEKFAAHGLKLEVPHVTGQQKLKGQSFVLTGSLPTLARDEATKLIKDAGGKVSGSVSSKTDWLLLGEDPGSKHEKAKKLDVTIISEDQLKKML